MMDHPLAPTTEDFNQVIESYSKCIDKIKSGDHDETTMLLYENYIETIKLSNSIEKFYTPEACSIEDYNRYITFLKTIRQNLEADNILSKDLANTLTDKDFIDSYMNTLYEKNYGIVYFSCTLSGLPTKIVMHVKTYKELDYIKILTFYKNLIQLAENLHNKTHNLSLEQTIFLYADFDIVDKLSDMYLFEYHDNDYNAVLKKVRNALDCIIPEYEPTAHTETFDDMYIKYFICNAIEKYFNTDILKSDVLYALKHKTSFDV